MQRLAKSCKMSLRAVCTCFHDESMAKSCKMSLRAVCTCFHDESITMEYHYSAQQFGMLGTLRMLAFTFTPSEL